MQKNRSRGFTLIELLVVIAIIGILSAVVLASLSTARTKGNDAAIQSDISTVRTEAEIYYGGGGGNPSQNTYGTLAWTTGASCTGAAASSVFGDPVIKNAMVGADADNGGGSVGCASADQTYVVAAQLTTNATSYWCADNTGKSEQVNAAFPSSAIASCP